MQNRQKSKISKPYPTQYPAVEAIRKNLTKYVGEKIIMLSVIKQIAE